MMRTLLVPSAAGVALALTTLAHAQTFGPPAATPAPPATDAAQSLQTLDADRDGSISATEAAANPTLAAQFAILDGNANGALEPAEFARFDVPGPLDTTRGTPGDPGTPGTPASPAAPGTAPAGTPPPIGVSPETPPPAGVPPPIETAPGGPPPAGTPPPAGAAPPPSQPSGTSPGN